MKAKIITFIRREAVLSAALLLAVLSMFLVAPDRTYITYTDYKTLALLFCLMTVMAGFQSLGIFHRIGEGLLKQVKGSRQVAFILVVLCFFSSMVITNDVALITFVPFAITVLKMAALEELLVPVVVMQTIAANLGSMVTPIGNPQNLYLYSLSGIPPAGFIRLMVPFAAVALVLLLAWLMAVRNKEIEMVSLKREPEADPGLGRAFLTYLLLFFACIGSVAQMIPWQALLILVVISILAVDRQLFCRVDYSLLLTFTGFFIFIGNMKRVPAFYEFISRMVTGNEVITAVVSSQVISNVPAALLLSGFTDQWKALIIGTNLGGLGTLIASMASLISYKYVAREFPEKRGRYLLVFTGANLVFLGMLLVFYGLG
ncbi:citrate transporter [Clostridium sp. MCC353]|uniref:SLC13 family permease n=1 Tax=Clostridium sp. MCC353 TaxID=2592646 RepID=UPI001C019726|nr:SLC13 family permease [Clostridium sp. MCC353]MBT9775649.1 citrate transporter [Clostridium sp. MCC353]